MTVTPRFGLVTGGLDALSDARFTGRDRLLIDRVLAALETHTHDGGTQLGDPTGAPGLVLGTGGQLPGDTTYYYVVTYVDEFGLESAPSTEVSVAAPTPVAAPQGPLLVAETGGSLDTGLYFYGLTAKKGAGETPISDIGTITVSDFRTVRVSIPGGMPAGADKVSVWRQGPTESWFTRVHTQADAADWVDDGTVPADADACLPENQPPLENTTESSSDVTITAPAGDLVQPTLAARWRIYRTEDAGVYGDTSLLADISDTTTEFGDQLVETYVDDGTVPLTEGTPPAGSLALTPSQLVAEFFEVNPQAGSSYTFQLSDRGSVVVRLTSGAPVAVTVPDYATTPFEVGSKLNVRVTSAAGATLTPAAGVTLNGATNVNQHEIAYLVNVAQDVWDVTILGAAAAAPPPAAFGTGYQLDQAGTGFYTDAGLSDEFAAGTLDAQWTPTNLASGTVSLVGNPVSPVYDLASRSGTLLAQADTDQGDCHLSAAQVLADGEQIIAAVLMPGSPGAANNEARIGMGVSGNATELMTGDASNIAVLFDGQDSGRVTFFGGVTTYGQDVEIGGARRMFLRMARDGADYHGFVSMDGKVWSALGTHAPTAPTHFHLYFGSLTSVTPSSPAPIYGVEWVRHVASLDLDPW